jgi:hypothetical protein
VSAPLPKATVAKACNAVRDSIPDGYCFLLLIVPAGDKGIAQYGSNIVREDAIKTLKEFLFRIGEEETWMKDIR